MQSDIEPGTILDDTFLLREKLWDADEPKRSLWRAKTVTEGTFPENAYVHIMLVEPEDNEDPSAPESSSAWLSWMGQLAAVTRERHALQLMEAHPDSETPYIAYLIPSAKSLSALISEGIEPQQVSAVISTLASIVSSIHDASVALGSIDAENVFIDEDGTLTLCCENGIVPDSFEQGATQNGRDLIALIYRMLTKGDFANVDEVVDGIPYSAGQVVPPSQLRSGVGVDMDAIALTGTAMPGPRVSFAIAEQLPTEKILPFAGTLVNQLPTQVIDNPADADVSDDDKATVEKDQADTADDKNAEADESATDVADKSADEADVASDDTGETDDEQADDVTAEADATEADESAEEIADKATDQADTDATDEADVAEPDTETDDATEETDSDVADKKDDTNATESVDEPLDKHDVDQVHETVDKPEATDHQEQANKPNGVTIGVMDKPVPSPKDIKAAKKAARKEAKAKLKEAKKQAKKAKKQAKRKPDSKVDLGEKALVTVEKVLDSRKIDSFFEPPRRYRHPSDATVDSSSRITRLIIIIMLVMFVLSVVVLAWPTPAKLRAEKKQQQIEKQMDADNKKLEHNPTVTPEIAAVNSLDPEGDNNEHPEMVDSMIDDNPDTYWMSRYYSIPTFGNKKGIGVAITLKEKAKVHSVSVKAVGKGGKAELRATSSDKPTEGPVLADGSFGASTTFKLKKPVVTDSLVLWITELPTDDDGKNRIKISEISVK